MVAAVHAINQYPFHIHNWLFLDFLYGHCRTYRLYSVYSSIMRILDIRSFLTTLMVITAHINNTQFFPLSISFNLVINFA